MIDLKNKVFLDSDGEMTFENKERLNFIMHFMKQGAVEQVATNKDGTFVREDAEISFNEIWLPCAESKQAEIEVLKTKLAKAQAVPEGFVLVKKVHPDAIVHNQGLGLFKECQVIYGWDGKSKDFKEALNKGFYHGVKLGAKAVLETAMIEPQDPAND